MGGAQVEVRVVGGTVWAGQVRLGPRSSGARPARCPSAESENLTRGWSWAELPLWSAWTHSPLNWPGLPAFSPLAGAHCPLHVLLGAQSQESGDAGRAPRGAGVVGPGRRGPRRVLASRVELAEKA